MKLKTYAEFTVTCVVKYNILVLIDDRILAIAQYICVMYIYIYIYTYIYIYIYVVYNIILCNICKYIQIHITYTYFYIYIRTGIYLLFWCLFSTLCLTSVKEGIGVFVNSIIFVVLNIVYSLRDPIVNNETHRSYSTVVTFLLLTKITKNEVALSYQRVRGLSGVARVSATRGGS